MTDTALLSGGPRDAQVVKLDSPTDCIEFPRYRDDMSLVMDIYVHASTRLHGDKIFYRYGGERIPEAPDPAMLTRTRRERFADFRDDFRKMLAGLRQP